MEVYITTVDSQAVSAGHLKFVFMNTSFYVNPQGSRNSASNKKLILIKTAHTLIWIFFNVVIFYLLYAVITNKIDKWV
jgi:hypothetical protein